MITRHRHGQENCLLVVSTSQLKVDRNKQAQRTSMKI